MQRARFSLARHSLPLLAALTALATGLARAAESAPDAALVRAREILKAHPLIDGHNDLPYVIRESGKPPRDVEAHDLTTRAAGDTDLPRLRAGGVGGQFWSVYIPSGADTGKRGFARIQLEQIDLALRMIERYPGDLALALTAGDIERANAAGRIASLLGIEGGHAIENSLGALRGYYRLGVRYMTLTHFNGNDWADSATEAARHGGLTAFGVEVVREMNRLGMLADLSHVSVETMNDVLDAAEAPVIFSHSNAQALSPTPRNVPDAVLARLPKNGGVVMVSFISLFNVQGQRHADWQAAFEKATGVKLGDADYDTAWDKYTVAHPEPRATLADVADHVEHVRDIAGIDHVAIGADFYGVPSSMATDLEDVASYPRLFAELIRRGWTEEMLGKLARGNLLRAMRDAERAAARLQKTRPASYATIEQLDGGKAQPDKL
jgi:membrane dipeptidase